MAGKGSSTGKSSGTDSRSAKTGQYVTKKYADTHKSTTVTEKKK
ncbi:MAG: multidrug transporter [Jatrophihabitantaceae bacterium]